MMPPSLAVVLCARVGIRGARRECHAAAGERATWRQESVRAFQCEFESSAIRARACSAEGAEGVLIYSFVCSNGCSRGALLAAALPPKTHCPPTITVLHCITTIVRIKCFASSSSDIDLGSSCCVITGAPTKRRPHCVLGWSTTAAYRTGVTAAVDQLT